MIAREEYRKRVIEEPQPIYLTPEELSKFVRDNFKKSTGKEFMIDDLNQEVFYGLCNYFTGTPGIYNLEKGIMLCGNIGVGKTETMKLFTTNPFASFGLIGCRQVSDGFSFTSQNENPEDHIRSFSNLRKAAKPHYFNLENLGMCFDDLGTETIPAMNYGNSKNVMAEIIMNRYDNRLPYNMTHLITNLMPDKIKTLYGSRFLDRITQMMNQVIFTQLESRRS